MPNTLIVLPLLLVATGLLGYLLLGWTVFLTLLALLCGAWASNSRKVTSRLSFAAASLAMGAGCAWLHVEKVSAMSASGQALASMALVALPGVLGLALAHWNRIQMARQAQAKAARTFVA